MLTSLREMRNRRIGIEQLNPQLFIRTGVNTSKPHTYFLHEKAPLVSGASCFILRAAALLVLLAAAAWTGIIPSNFVAANDLLHVLHLSRPSHACLIEFPALFPLELFFKFIERRLRTALP
jgi:hypothetical protein